MTTITESTTETTETLETPPIDTRPWCWTADHYEGAYGPFATRAEALADARERFAGQPGRVTLGRCAYLDPAAFVDQDLDSLLDDIDDEACEDGWGGIAGLGPDEHLVAIRGGGGGGDGETQRRAAGEALNAALRAWARAWLVSDCWNIDGPTEDVTL